MFLLGEFGKLCMCQNYSYLKFSLLMEKECNK